LGTAKDVLKQHLCGESMSWVSAEDNTEDSGGNVTQKFSTSETTRLF